MDLASARGAWLIPVMLAGVLFGASLSVFCVAAAEATAARPGRRALAATTAAVSLCADGRWAWGTSPHSEAVDVEACPAEEYVSEHRLRTNPLAAGAARACRRRLPPSGDGKPCPEVALRPTLIMLHSTCLRC